MNCVETVSQGLLVVALIVLTLAVLTLIVLTHAVLVLVLTISLLDARCLLILKFTADVGTHTLCITLLLNV